MTLLHYFVRHLTRFLLVFALTPLILFGAISFSLSYRDLKKSAALQSTFERAKVQSFIEQKMNGWSTLLETASLGGPALERLLFQEKNFQRIQIISADGLLQNEAVRPGVLSFPKLDWEEPTFRSLIKARRAWQGKIQTFSDGSSAFTLVHYQPGDATRAPFYLAADVQPNVFSDFIAGFKNDLFLIEDGKVFSTVLPGTVYEEKTIPQTTDLPFYGWQIVSQANWWSVYRPAMIFLSEFALAIFVMGFLTALLGIFITPKIEAALIHQERLSTLGLISGVVGHEIGTALSVLRNSLRYLSSHVPTEDEKVGRHLTMMDEQIKAANLILANVMDFSKKKARTAAPLSLNEVIAQAVEGFPFPPLIQVQSDYALNLRLIKGDVIEIKQVLFNIFQNAIHAMDNQGTLRLETKLDNSSVKLSIHDSGRGIAKHHLDKIFEPFYSTKSQGTGLGLSVVKNIVDRMGGQIKIESAEERGTTITLLFPGLTENRTERVDVIAVNPEPVNTQS